MKLSRISFLFLLVFLFVPYVSFAQSAANKSWPSFWQQFSSAVNRKSKVALKNLMAPEKDFSSGGGIEDRNGWLRLVERERWWGKLQKAVRSGTSLRNDGRTRATNEGDLWFRFIRGRWFFIGPGGV